MEGSLSMNTEVQQIPIAQIKVQDRARKDLGDIAALADSIDKRGLLHPIVVNAEHRLIVGGRRLEAFKRLGRETIPAIVNPSFSELADILQAERDENACRKDFAPTEAVELGQRIKPILEAEAKERQEAGRQVGGRLAGNGRPKKLASESDTSKSLQQPEGSSDSDKASGGKRTDDQVASAVGMGRDRYRKAAAVVTAAKQSPEHYGDLPAKMDATGSVDGVYKELERRQVQAAGEAANPCPGMKTPHQEAAEAPSRRWHQSLHRIYVLFTSIRDAGGIKELARNWPQERREENTNELRRIVGELQRMISDMEGMQ